MPTFFTFKRLSSLGVAVLILIMVLMLYPVLPPEPQPAHAATRLGLHVTQEELNIWRQRMNDSMNGIGGVSYQTMYNNRIKADADAFRNQSHPRGDGYWAGYTGGCVPAGQTVVPGRGNGILLMKAAYIFLLTGNTSYADAVKSELLNQIAQPGTDFSNESIWCKSGGPNTANEFETVPWIVRLVTAYDYLNAGGLYRIYGPAEG